MKMRYRLSKQQKESISKNLIDVMASSGELIQDSVTFVENWILSGAEEKTKAFYDVWDFVLCNYMPETRPVLFRSCKRRENGKIRSFTGSIYCAQKMCNRTGFLLICDMETVLQCSIMQKQGEYQHTFFPIADLLKKDSYVSKCKFSKRLIDDYVKEDEYIMRIDLNYMYSCKWYQERG